MYTTSTLKNITGYSHPKVLNFKGSNIFLSLIVQMLEDRFKWNQVASLSQSWLFLFYIFFLFQIKKPHWYLGL